MSTVLMCTTQEPYLPQWLNTGGPRSRSRSERLYSTILGKDRGSVRCPRVIQVALDFGAADPLEVVARLLEEAGIHDPEMLRGRFDVPREPCICQASRSPSSLSVEGGGRSEVLRQVLILGLSTSFHYDPGRPLLFTRTSLTRRLDVYDARGFYA